MDYETFNINHALIIALTYLFRKNKNSSDTLCWILSLSLSKVVVCDPSCRGTTHTIFR